MADFMITQQMMDLSLEPADNYCDEHTIDDFKNWLRYQHNIVIDSEIIKIIKHQYLQIANQYENQYVIIIYPYQMISAIIIYILKQYYPYYFANCNFDDNIQGYFIEKSKFQDKNRFKIVTQNLIRQFLTNKIHPQDLAILDISFQNMTI